MKMLAVLWSHPVYEGRAFITKQHVSACVYYATKKIGLIDAAFNL